MPRIRPLILAAFILLSACVTAPPTPPATAPPAPLLATLETVVGEVQFRLADVPAFIRLAAGDELRQVGQVITGAGARVVLAVGGDALLYLPAHTTLDLGGGGSVTLLTGQTWAAAGEALTVVDTPAGWAALRDALMNVAYDPATETTTVTCLRGLCLLANDAGEALIPAGEQASVTTDHHPGQPQPAPAGAAARGRTAIPELAALLPNPTARATGGQQLNVQAKPGANPTLDTPTPTASPTSVPTSTPSPTAGVASATPTDLPWPPPTPTSPPPTTASPTATIVATATQRIPSPPPTATNRATTTRTFTPAAPTPTSTPSAPTAGAQGSGPQPGPSPTWALAFVPTPLPAAGPSKLGFHVTGDGGAMIDFAAAAQPAVMKGVEEIAFLQGVKAVSPNTVTIGRFVVDQPNIGVGDPVQRAIDFVNEQLPRYQEHAAYVDYWEGWNEVAWPNYEWYGQFEATRACEMQKHGLRAAIGAFSAGTPEPWQFEFFLPAIEAGRRCGAILTLHEYGAPTMYLWWTQGLPGGPWYPDRGPLAGRYRWLYRDILIPRGLTLPLVISEAGIDGLVAMGLRPGPVGPGWLEFGEYWVQAGLTQNPTQFYLEQLIWYDSLLRQDDYVIGATIYTVSGGISQQQATYEAVSLAPLLTEYMRALFR